MKRIIVITLALIFGLIGLGMSLCGGGFLLAEMMSPKYWNGIGALATLSLVIGIALTVVCFRALLKQSKNDPPP